MTPERLYRLKHILNRRQPDLTVLLDDVHKPHNFSAIVRTADAVGVAEMHGVWANSKLRVGNHTSGGSRKWIKIKTHSSIERAHASLSDLGFTIYAAHLSSRSIDYREIDYTTPTAIMLGAELDGLSNAAVALADQHIAIPMEGAAKSLNVSVAAALILYEAQRQRQLAGFYEKRRLTDVVYNRTLFEWLHPDVAEYCRKHKRDYPKINNHGELIDFTMVS